MNREGLRRAGWASELAGLMLLIGLAGVAWPGLLKGCRGLLLSGVGQDAIDLRLRLTQLVPWFHGVPVYELDAHAVYPPAGFLVLRALVVVPQIEVARVAWFVQLALCAAAVGVFAARTAGLNAWSHRLILLISPLLLVGMQAGIGNGQLHMLPVVLGSASVLLLATGPARWGRDLLAAGCFAVALSKPSLTLPFAPLVLLVPGRLRPTLLLVALYGVLTWIAVWPQPAPLPDLAALWVERALAGATNGANDGGDANTQTLLQYAGWWQAGRLVVIGWWTGLAAWAYGHRRADPLLLLGIAGIVSRVSMYHRLYDDVLVIPALLALLRVATNAGSATGRPRGLRATAGALAALTFLAMWIPRWWLTDEVQLSIMRLLLWLLDLLVLTRVCAWDARPQVSGTPPRVVESPS